MTVTGSPKLFMITESRLSKGSVHVSISGTKINQTDEFHRVHVFLRKLQKSIKALIFVLWVAMKVSWKFEIQVLDSGPVNMKKYTVTV